MGDHADKPALLVIDMQKYFLKGSSDSAAQKLIASCQEVIGLARAADVPIISLTTEYRRDGKDWPQTCRERPDARCANLVVGNGLVELIDGIDIRLTDFRIKKQRYSGFYGTNLDDMLRGLACDLLYVVGCSAEASVLTTLSDAYNRGYRTSFIGDAVASEREPTERFLDYAEYFF